MSKVEYSLGLCRELEERANDAGLEVRHPPMRYEAGHLLETDIKGISPAVEGRVVLEVDKFLGGGFAGQVYRCRLRRLDIEGEAEIAGLYKGGLYSVKIVVPPTSFSKNFRNFIYWLAFQGPFSSQVNYDACRAGLIWQKLFCMAAPEALGAKTAVKDAYASFYDPVLQSYGEITEWVEGRMWHLEPDRFIRRRLDWRHLDLQETDSREFVEKRRFMADMVDLMHSMGSPEFARQYEWWTMKSQPNVMRRSDLSPADESAQKLCAIDFRPGLALLPWLPMSPGDIYLIFAGLFQRRRLVQFDRCDLDKLKRYVDAHPASFEGAEGLLEELETRDRAYRSSLPDITSHGLKPLFDRELRSKVRQGLIEGYLGNDLVDRNFGNKLAAGGLRFGAFYLLGAIPLAGKLVRKIWGKGAFRRHLRRAFSEPPYFKRALRAHVARDLVKWHRSGRVSEKRARSLAAHPLRFLCERFTVGLLPIGLHRMIMRPRIIWERVAAFFGFLHKFITSFEYREEWFLAEIAAGERDGMLSPEERTHIESIVRDPFIVQYLKCLGVHFATLPVTQVVGLIAGGIWAGWLLAHGHAWSDAVVAFGGTMVFLQVFPISPGSICRGLFVVYLMIRERNWRDYIVAAPLSFVKYIGYLAFPLQMTATYPDLARFMASRWVTNAIHIVPVFGEKGALLEHWVFDLFFNLPQNMGRHLKGLLSIWLVFGLILTTGLFLGFELSLTGKWGLNLVLALLAVFILPRILYAPLMAKRARRKGRNR